MWMGAALQWRPGAVASGGVCLYVVQWPAGNAAGVFQVLTPSSFVLLRCPGQEDLSTLSVRHRHVGSFLASLSRWWGACPLWACCRPTDVVASDFTSCLRVL